MPEILVVMPTYHGEHEWVKKAVASVREQTFRDWELWLVKDGCAEECERCRERLELIKSMAREDQRIRAFALPVRCGEMGVPATNFPLLTTEHPLIAYLSDDNWWDPEHLDSLHHIVFWGNCGFAYSDISIHDREGKFLRVTETVTAEGRIDHSCFLHRRELLRFGLWEESKSPDWDHIKRWVDNGVSHRGTKKPTLHYRRRTDVAGSPRE